MMIEPLLSDNAVNTEHSEISRYSQVTIPSAAKSGIDIDICFSGHDMAGTDELHSSLRGARSQQPRGVDLGPRYERLRGHGAEAADTGLATDAAQEHIAGNPAVGGRELAAPWERPRRRHTTPHRKKGAACPSLEPRQSFFAFWASSKF